MIVLNLKSYIVISTVLILFTSIFGQVIINEYSASNLTEYFDNYDKAEDWIELYNSGGSEINLGGYYLSDDIQVNSLTWIDLNLNSGP